MTRNTFRKRLGEVVGISEIAATQGKNTFGELLERMQTPAAKKGMAAAFNAAPAALGRAAVKAAGRRC